ncbi:MAG: RNase adapter RapZ [Desulfocapsaceae bacterium]|jgi:nitroreductase/NAD-dependent dihydropyrimidine dehydrogenase PreA subunit|nr:RNase adapter RapZ [Desulfocapsaceae bacterium]
MIDNPLPVIDRERCISCGLCIDICPDKALAAGSDKIAEVVASSCMGCGHCQAICPVEAVSMPGLTADLGLTAIPGTADKASCNHVEVGSLLHLMRARRSCRAFKPDPVKLSLLSDLARVGTTAPSGTNSQGWQFALLPQRTDVIGLGEVTADFYRRLNRKAANPLYRLVSRFFYGDRLGHYYRRHFRSVENGLDDWYENGVDRLFHGAPAAIVVAADRLSSSCPQEDALLATQNILLAAEAMGVSTCLIGFVVEAARNDRRIAALLRFAETESIYSVIGCGYPVHSFKRYAGRKSITPRIVRLTGMGTYHQVKQEPGEMKQQNKKTRLVLYSFGFKHGVPVDANMVWDVRFLPNPYWQEDLRPMSGREQQVSDYVIKSDQGTKFLDLLKPLLAFLLDREINLEQKNLRFAVGCTGGRHRSVAVVEALRAFLVNEDLDLEVFHRDIDRDDNGSTLS